MFKMSYKAAAVSLVLGAWAFQAQAVEPLMTLTSTGATTVVGGVATAEVMLTVNASFNLLSMDALLGYGVADLTFQTGAPVYDGHTALEIAAAAPPGWVFNLDDPLLSPSLSVVTDPFLMPHGLPIAAHAPELLTLSFKGLMPGAHVVTLGLDVLDEATLIAAGSGDPIPIHYSTQFTINVTAVPEPASYALLLGGLAAIGALTRRRARQA